MGPRLSVFVGLVAGVLVALAVLAAVILAVPAALPPAPASASPSAAAAVESPSPSPAVSASPIASPSGSPGSSPSASGSPGSSPSASGGSATTTDFHVGQAAPALTVPQVGGGTIDLAALKGKAVWINFMQTTCPPCIDEFPRMNGFASRYADAGLVIIAVDISEDEGKVAEFALRMNATFSLGLDTTGAAQQAWGAYGLPVHYWIDKTGIGSDVMARGVAAILPGVTVTP